MSDLNSANGQRSTIVIGAGAIGGTMAAYMAKAGLRLTLVTKHQSSAEAAAGPGLRVFGVRGENRVRVPAVASVDELDPPVDLAFLATKAPDMIAAAQALLPLLRQDSTVVSLQNGVCEDALAQVLGRERVIGCVVGYGATLHGPGEVEMTSDGELVIGNLDGRDDPRLKPLAEMMSAVVDTRISSNIMGELYSKLIVNSCINTLGALCGLRLGKLLALKKVRQVFLDIMREAMAVADAMGLKVEPGGGGKLDYYSFLAGQGGLASFKRHLMIRLIGFKYRRLKSSTLQSLERGRVPETEYLNGYIVAKGREHGVPCPVNESLVAMIAEIAAGQRKISLDNLAAF